MGYKVGGVVCSGVVVSFGIGNLFGGVGWCVVVVGVGVDIGYIFEGGGYSDDDVNIGVG